MYSSSASPHTSRPARSQHDARTRPPLSHPVAPPRRRAPSWLILRPPCPRPHTTRPARALSFPHPPLPLSPQHHLLYTHSRRFAGTPAWTPSPHHPTRRAPAGRPARSFFVHTIPAHPLSRSCHPGSPQQPHADASDATWSCTRSDTECSGVASKATWTVQPSARSIFFLPLAHPLAI